ncbi:MAG: polyprotein [Hangzhou frankliniella intonsa flavivirus 2]|nr:MAG: polyprotein [Hangzhou frankliniella intonsa flavivirus 2]
MCVLAKTFRSAKKVGLRQMHNLCQTKVDWFKPGMSGSSGHPDTCSMAYIHAGVRPNNPCIGYGLTHEQVLGKSFVFHSKARGMSPNSLSWIKAVVGLCCIVASLGLTLPHQSSKLDDMGRAIDCINDKIRTQRPTESMFRDCKVDPVIAVIENGALTSRSMDLKQITPAVLTARFEQLVKDVQAIADRLNDPQVVTLRAANAASLLIAKSLENGHSLVTLGKIANITGITNVRTGADWSTVETKVARMAAQHQRLIDMTTRCDNQIAQINIMQNRLDVLSDLVERIGQRLSYLEQLIQTIKTRLPRVTTQHVQEMSLSALEAHGQQLQRQLSTVELFLQEKASEARYRYVVENDVPTLLEENELTLDEEIKVGDDILDRWARESRATETTSTWTETLPKATNCTDVYRLSECIENYSFNNTVCNYTHGTDYISVSQGGYFQISQHADLCNVRFLSNLTHTYNIVMISGCERDFIANNVHVKCKPRVVALFETRKLIPNLHGGNVEFNANYVLKIAKFIIAVIICWCIAEFSQSSLIGVLLFAFFLINGSDGECNSTLVVMHADIIENGMDSRKYVASGSVPAGTCVRLGNRTVGIDSFHVKYNYAMRGVVPFAWVVTQSSEYGCPGGQSERVCNGTLPALDKDTIREVYCESASSTMWSNSNCGANGEVFIHAAIDYHINETVSVYELVANGPFKYATISYTTENGNVIRHVHGHSNSVEDDFSIDIFDIEAPAPVQWIFVRQDRSGGQEFRVSSVASLPGSLCYINQNVNGWKFQSPRCPQVAKTQRGAHMEITHKRPTVAYWYDTDYLVDVTNKYSEHVVITADRSGANLDLQSSVADVRIVAKERMVGGKPRLCVVRNVVVTNTTIGIVAGIAHSTVCLSFDSNNCFVHLLDNNCWVQGSTMRVVRNFRVEVNYICGLIVDNSIRIGVNDGIINVNLTEKMARNVNLGIQFINDKIASSYVGDRISMGIDFVSNIADTISDFLHFSLMKIVKYIIAGLVSLAAVYMFIEGHYLIGCFLSVIVAIDALALVVAADDNVTHINVGFEYEDEHVRQSVIAAVYAVFTAAITYLVSTPIVPMLSMWFAQRILGNTTSVVASGLRRAVTDAVGVAERISMRYVIALEFFDKVITVAVVLVLYCSVGWHAAFAMLVVKEVPLVYSTIMLLFKGKVYIPSPCHWVLAENAASKWFRPSDKSAIVPSCDIHDSRREMRVGNTRIYRPCDSLKTIDLGLVEHCGPGSGTYSLFKIAIRKDFEPGKKNFRITRNGERLFYISRAANGVYFGAFHTITFDVSDWVCIVENDFFCSGPNRDEVLEVFENRKKMVSLCMHKKFKPGDSGKVIDNFDGTWYCHRGVVSIAGHDYFVSTMWNRFSCDNHSGKNWVEIYRNQMKEVTTVSQAGLKVSIESLKVDKKIRMAPNVEQQLKTDVYRQLSSVWAPKFQRAFKDYGTGKELCVISNGKVDIVESCMRMMQGNEQLFAAARRVAAADYSTVRKDTWPSAITMRGIALYNNHLKSLGTAKIREMQSAINIVKAERAAVAGSSVSAKSESSASGPTATEVGATAGSSSAAKVKKGSVSKPTGEPTIHEGKVSNSKATKSLRKTTAVDKILQKRRNEASVERLGDAPVSTVKNHSADSESEDDSEIQQYVTELFSKVEKAGFDVDQCAALLRDLVFAGATLPHGLNGEFVNVTTEYVPDEGLAKFVCNECSVPMDDRAIRLACLGKVINDESVPSTSKVTETFNDDVLESRGPETIMLDDVTSAISQQKIELREIVLNASETKFEQYKCLELKGKIAKEMLDIGDNRLTDKGYVNIFDFSGVWAYMIPGRMVSCYHCLFKRDVTIALPEGRTDWFSRPSTERYALALKQVDTRNVENGDVVIYGVPGSSENMPFERETFLGEVGVVVNPKLNAFFFVQCRNYARTNGAHGRENLFSAIDSDGNVINNIGNTKGWSGLPVLSLKGEVLGLFGTISVTRNLVHGGECHSITSPPNSSFNVTDDDRQHKCKVEFSDKSLVELAKLLDKSFNTKYANTRLRISAPTGWGKTTKLPLGLSLVFQGGSAAQSTIYVLIPQRVACQRAFVRICDTIKNDEKYNQTMVSLMLGNQEVETFPHGTMAQHQIIFSTYGKFISMHAKNMSSFASNRDILLLLDEIHARDTDVIVVESLLIQCNVNYIALTATTFISDIYQDEQIGSEDKRPFTVIDHPLGIAYAQIPKKERDEYWWLRISDDKKSWYGFPRTCWDPVKQMLVFCASHEECESGAKNWNREYPRIPARPFYRGKNLDESCKVIFATKIAQVSLTLPDLITVVDFQHEYRQSFKINELCEFNLSMERCGISREDSIQRRGRVGRVSNGHYVHASTSQLKMAEAYPYYESVNAGLKLRGIRLASTDLLHENVKEGYYMADVARVRNVLNWSDIQVENRVNLLSKASIDPVIFMHLEYLPDIWREKFWIDGGVAYGELQHPEHLKWCKLEDFWALNKIKFNGNIIRQNVEEYVESERLGLPSQKPLKRLMKLCSELPAHVGEDVGKVLHANQFWVGMGTTTIAGLGALWAAHHIWSKLYGNAEATGMYRINRSTLKNQLSYMHLWTRKNIGVFTGSNESPIVKKFREVKNVFSGMLSAILKKVFPEDDDVKTKLHSGEALFYYWHEFITWVSATLAANPALFGIAAGVAGANVLVGAFWDWIRHHLGGAASALLMVMFSAYQATSIPVVMNLFSIGTGALIYAVQHTYRHWNDVDVESHLLSYLASTAVGLLMAQLLEKTATVGVGIVVPVSTLAASTIAPTLSDNGGIFKWLMSPKPGFSGFSVAVNLIDIMKEKMSLSDKVRAMGSVMLTAYNADWTNYAEMVAIILTCAVFWAVHTAYEATVDKNKNDDNNRKSGATVPSSTEVRQAQNRERAYNNILIVYDLFVVAFSAILNPANLGMAIIDTAIALALGPGNDGIAFEARDIFTKIRFSVVANPLVNMVLIGAKMINLARSDTAAMLLFGGDEKVGLMAKVCTALESVRSAIINKVVSISISTDIAVKWFITPFKWLVKAIRWLFGMVQSMVRGVGSLIADGFMNTFASRLPNWMVRFFSLAKRPATGQPLPDSLMTSDCEIIRGLLRFGCGDYLAKLAHKLTFNNVLYRYIATDDFHACRILNCLQVDTAAESIDDYVAGIGDICAKNVRVHRGVDNGFAVRVLCSPFIQSLNDQGLLFEQVTNDAGVYTTKTHKLQFNQVGNSLLGICRNIDDASDIIICQFNGPDAVVLIGGFKEVSGLGSNITPSRNNGEEVINAVNHHVKAVSDINGPRQLKQLVVYTSKVEQFLEHIVTKVPCMNQEATRKALGMILKLSVLDSKDINLGDPKEFVWRHLKVSSVPDDFEIVNQTQSFILPPDVYKLRAERVIEGIIKNRVRGLSWQPISVFNPLVVKKDAWTMFWCRMITSGFSDNDFAQYLAMFMRCPIGIVESSLILHPHGGKCCDDCFIAIDHGKLCIRPGCGRVAIIVRSFSKQVYARRGKDVEPIEFFGNAPFWGKLFEKIQGVSVRVWSVNEENKMAFCDVFEKDSTESAEDETHLMLITNDHLRGNYHPKIEDWCTKYIVYSNPGPLQVLASIIEQVEQLEIFLMNQRAEYPTNNVLVTPNGAYFLTNFGYRLGIAMYARVLEMGCYIGRVKHDEQGGSVLVPSYDENVDIKNVSKINDQENLQYTVYCDKDAHLFSTELAEAWAGVALVDGRVSSECTNWDDAPRVWVCDKKVACAANQTLVNASNKREVEKQPKSCTKAILKVSEATTRTHLNRRVLPRVPDGMVNLEYCANATYKSYACVGHIPTARMTKRIGVKNAALFNAGMVTSLSRSNSATMVGEIAKMFNNTTVSIFKRVPRLNAGVVSRSSIVTENDARILAAAGKLTVTTAADFWLNGVYLDAALSITKANFGEWKRLLLCQRRYLAFLYYDVEDKLARGYAVERDILRYHFADYLCSQVLTTEAVEEVSKQLKYFKRHGDIVTMGDFEDDTIVSLGDGNYYRFQRINGRAVVRIGTSATGKLVLLYDQELLADCIQSLGVVYKEEYTLEMFQVKLRMYEANFLDFKKELHSNYNILERLLYGWAYGDKFGCNNASAPRLPLSKSELQSLLPVCPEPRNVLKEALYKFMEQKRTIDTTNVTMTETHASQKMAQMGLARMAEEMDDSVGRIEIMHSSSCAVHFDGVSRRNLSWEGLTCSHADVLKRKMSNQAELLGKVEGAIRPEERLKVGNPIVPLLRGKKYLGNFKVNQGMLARRLKGFDFASVKPDKSNQKMWDLFKRKDRLYLPPGPSTSEFDEGRAPVESRCFFKESCFDYDTGMISTSRMIWDLTCGRGGGLEYAMISRLTGGVTTKIVANTLWRDGHSIPNVKNLYIKASRARVDLKIIASNCQVCREFVKIERKEAGLKGAGDIRQQEVLDAFKICTFGSVGEEHDDKFRPDLIVFDAGEAHANIDTEAKWLKLNHKIFAASGASRLRVNGRDVYSVLEALPQYLKNLASNGTAKIKMMGFTRMTEDILEYLINGKDNPYWKDSDMGVFKSAFAWKCPTTSLISREWYLILTGYTRSKAAEQLKRQRIDVPYLIGSIREQWYGGLDKMSIGAKQLWENLHSRRTKMTETPSNDLVVNMLAKEYYGYGVASVIYGEDAARRAHDVRVPMKYTAFPTWEMQGNFKLPQVRDQAAINNRIIACTAINENYGCTPTFVLDGEVFTARMTDRVELVKQMIKGAGKRTIAPSGLFKNVTEICMLSEIPKYSNEKHHANALLSDMAYDVFGMTYLNSAVGHTNATEAKVIASLKKRLDIKPKEPSPADQQKLLDAAWASCTPEYWRIANGPEEKKFRPLTIDEARQYIHNQGKGGKFDTWLNLAAAMDDPGFIKKVEKLVERCSSGAALDRYETYRVKNETKAKKIAGNGRLEIEPSLDPNSHLYKGMKKAIVSHTLEELYQCFKAQRAVDGAPIIEHEGFIQLRDVNDLQESVFVKFHALTGNEYNGRIPHTLDLEVAPPSKMQVARVAYVEKFVNLFTSKGSDVTCGIGYAQCVSADFKMSRGIAEEFTRLWRAKYPKLDLRQQLRSQRVGVGDVAQVKYGDDTWYFLVTKERHFDKPTLGKMVECLDKMFGLMVKSRVKVVHAPRLGSGLDQLDFAQVREVIKSSLGRSNSKLSEADRLKVVICKGEREERYSNSRGDVLHHTHVCDACSVLYRHEHTGFPRPHGQQGNQCPNPKCLRYFAHDIEGKNNHNPTNARVVREPLKVGEMFWTREIVDGFDNSKTRIRVLNYVARENTSDSMSYSNIVEIIKNVASEAGKDRTIKKIWFNQIGSGDNYLSWDKIRKVYSTELTNWYNSVNRQWLSRRHAEIHVGLGKFRSMKNERGKITAKDTVLTYDPEMFSDPEFMKFVRERGGKDYARELRLKLLHEASKIMPRGIQFCDMANRVMDVMIYGQMQEHHNNVEKLYSGSTTGTPLWMLGNVMKGADDFYCNTAEQEFIQCSAKGGHYKDPVLVYTYDEAHKNGHLKCREREYVRKVMCGDFSGFDGTVHLTDHAICYLIDKRIYNKKYHALLKNRVEHVMWSIIITDDGHVIARQGQRGSGDQNTSRGNTFINQYTHIAAIAEAIGISAEEAAKPIGEVWYKAKFECDTLKEGESMVVKDFFGSYWRPNEKRLKECGFKRFYLTRITNFNDGDDNVHFGHYEDLDMLNKKGVKFIERTGKLLRCGTKSGYDVVSKFNKVSFCSHGFERTRIGTIDGVGLSNVEEGKRRNVHEFDIESVRNIETFVQHSADHRSRLRIAYLPTRPLSEIVGKLVFTMKATTTEIDLCRDYGVTESQRRYGAKNEERIQLTRGKILAYLLNYIHILPVRQICLATLAVIGDGVCDLRELRRRYNVPGIMKSWSSAIKSVFSIDDMDEVECLHRGYDRDGLALIAYNTRLQYEDLITPHGKVCPPNAQQLSIKLTEWLDKIEVRENIKVDWKTACAADSAVLCRVPRVDEPQSRKLVREVSRISKEASGKNDKVNIINIMTGLATLMVVAPVVSEWDRRRDGDFFIITNHAAAGLRQLDRRLGFDGSMYAKMRSELRSAPYDHTISRSFMSTRLISEDLTKDERVDICVIHAYIPPEGSSVSLGGQYGSKQSRSLKTSRLAGVIKKCEEYSLKERSADIARLTAMNHTASSVAHIATPSSFVLVSLKGFLHRFKLADLKGSLKSLKISGKSVPYQHMSIRNASRG